MKDEANIAFGWLYSGFILCKMKDYNIGKAKLYSRNDGWEIIIPSRKNPGILFFGFLWFLGWMLGVLMVWINYLKPEEVTAQGYESIMFLISWSIGMLFFVYMICWVLFGKEIVTRKNNILKIRQYIFGMGASSSFKINYIKNIQYSPSAIPWYSPKSIFSGMGLIGGKIIFDLSSKKIAIGDGLKNSDALKLKEWLDNNFSQ